MHATEEENSGEIVKGEEEIGEDKCDENIIELEKHEGGALGWEDPICAPCEDPDAFDADVDIAAEVQRAATDPGQPRQPSQAQSAWAST